MNWCSRCAATWTPPAKLPLLRLRAHDADGRGKARSRPAVRQGRQRHGLARGADCPADAQPHPGARPAAMIAPGQPAPEFSLPDQDGTIVKLEDLRGQTTVLVFYPND